MFPSPRTPRLKVWSAAFAVLAFTTLSMAQTSRVAGAVQGSVMDQTGSAVAGATITLRNPATNRTRLTSTDLVGLFRVGELPVGQYELHVGAPGFSLYTHNALVVSIGRVSQLTVQLVPAVVQQQITVSEQPSSIDASQTTEATTINPERIEESPVVSRNYLDFVLLAPQLTRSNQRANAGKSSLADSGFSFAGLRSRSNSLYIDGVENNDEFTGSGRTELSPETVQEFPVVNNGLSAESGGGASGPINVITKSGVNTLHDDAFVFVQNGSVNARDPLTNETETPYLNRFRTGLSAGGPIIRDRTFYYVAGEQEGAHADDSSLISASAAGAVSGICDPVHFPESPLGPSTPICFPRLAARQRFREGWTITSMAMSHSCSSTH